MFELIMIAFYMMKLPSIILQPFDNFSATHNVCTIHTNDESVKNDLVILPKIAFDPYWEKEKGKVNNTFCMHSHAEHGNEEALGNTVPFCVRTQ